ncbi:flagellar hook-basal body complex protein [Clostridium hydrogeniformans]|uniref:flagellar hook-basal body complex protein n=1 Tax=Clostridium hydrogeniformans TaxID=349933 RepID=UPI0004800523|nr:flagellar hook-basal body complex protein [Clostridium hydrogeniformans]
MLRSMYSGISGMKVNQTKLDVVGNNIANVGTTAFKGQRTRFQDVLSQNAGRAMAPSLNLGGVNPRQVGLGVQLAGIDTLVTQGMMQPTGRNLDLAVDGEGYFMVARGEKAFGGEITVVNNTIGNSNGRDIMFTRDGSFGTDHEGNLVTADGYRVLGYSVGGSIEGNGNLKYVDADSKTLQADNGLKTLKIPEKINDGGKDVRIISFSIDKTGLIKGVCEGGKITVLGQVAMSSFRNPAGLEKMGGNLYRNSSNSGEPVVKTGIGATNDNSKGYGDMLQGMLEMSNVDLAEQFTDMIVTTRAFQASGKMISSGDEILQDIINLKR